MRASHLSLGLALFLVVGGAGCGGGGDDVPDGGKRQDGGVPDAPQVTRLVWSKVVVDDQNAGHQPEIVQAPDGSLAVAYFRKAADEGTCARLPTSPPVSRFEVVYALEQADGKFATEVVDTISLLTLEGLSLAFDGSGKAAVAVQGGAEGQYRCGGSDMMLYTRGGAGAWTSVTVDGDGMATPVLAEDAACCTNYQSYCTAGAQDTVGTWPTLAYCGGEALLAYRDIHFGGWAQDDEAKSDIEFARGSGGLALSTIDATCGAGTYTKLLADDACNAWVMHYNRFSHACDDCGRPASSAGIWVQWEEDGTWKRNNVVPEYSIGYKPGFARFGTSFGIAFYPPKQNRQNIEQKLWYVSSEGGVLWGSPEVVDGQGDTGRSPSLAFDPAGRPTIAYYRCRDQYNPNTTDCDPAKDGLKYAVKGAVWESVLVFNEGGVRDGEYVSLAYDRDGLPAIAYQATYTDASTNEQVRELVVARSKVQ